MKTKVGRVEYVGIITLCGREHPSAVDGSPGTEGGEGQASRMRHALPDEGT